jgi:hypothetical protein
VALAGRAFVAQTVSAAPYGQKRKYVLIAESSRSAVWECAELRVAIRFLLSPSSRRPVPERRARHALAETSAATQLLLKPLMFFLPTTEQR